MARILPTMQCVHLEGSSRDTSTVSAIGLSVADPDRRLTDAPYFTSPALFAGLADPVLIHNRLPVASLARAFEESRQNLFGEELNHRNTSEVKN